MKLQTFFLGFLSAALLAMVGYVAITKPADAELGFGVPSIQKSTTANSSTTMSSTPVKVLSANTGRLSATVCNPSTSSLAWVTTFPASISSTTSTVGASNYFVPFSGETVYFGSCYRITPENMDYGAIWAVRAAGVEKVTSKEVTASQ